MMRQNKNLMDINTDALYNILKQNQGDINDAIGSKKKSVVVTFDLLALIAEKTKVSKSKEKVVVSLDLEGSEADDFSELNKITALLAKAFNRRNFYLGVRLRMVYTGEGQQLGGVRRRMTWRQFILALGLHTKQEMAEDGAYWDGSDRLIPTKGILGIIGSRSLILVGQAPEKATGVDLFYLCSMNCETTNIPRLLAQYLFRHAEGRKSGARLLGGNFNGRLAMHFGLVSDEGLRGLQVVTQELPLNDLYKLERLNIYTRYEDTWAWVAQGSERQHAAAAGAHEADEADLAVEEAAQEIPASAQAPPPPSPIPQSRTMS
nr:hypothetical protein [Tanacetum cinerariifolium]